MLRLALALLVLVGPASAFAQDVFTPQHSNLKAGQKVKVLMDGACGDTSCPPELVKGKIIDFTPESILVDSGRLRRELEAARIQFVERSRDGIWNGVLIGFAVGFSLGFVSVLADGCDPGQWCLFDGPSFAAAVGLLGGGIGAGVGAATDAMIAPHRVVYARLPTPTRMDGSQARTVGFRVRF